MLTKCHGQCIIGNRQYRMGISHRRRRDSRPKGGAPHDSRKSKLPDSRIPRSFTAMPFFACSAPFAEASRRPDENGGYCAPRIGGLIRLCPAGFPSPSDRDGFAARLFSVWLSRFFCAVTEPTAFRLRKIPNAEAALLRALRLRPVREVLIEHLLPPVGRTRRPASGKYFRIGYFPAA